MQTYLSLAGPAGGEPYIVQHGDCIGDTLYRVTTASERDAQAEVLAFIGDPKVCPDELYVWRERFYVERFGAPDDIVAVEPACAFPSYSVEAACPVCRPGAVADGARAVRCILHGGESEAIQPTNASADGFRLAGEAPARERADR